MNELIHLLNRTSFGPTPQSVREIETLGYEGYIDRQLGPDGIDDALVDDLIAEAFPQMSMTLAELQEAHQEAIENQGRISPAGALIGATLLRQLLGQRQLHEVMTEFWTNHFNVFLLDGPVAWMKPAEDRDVIRPRAFGRFRDLVRADAASPAMVYYLDNYANTADGPQENYARELMELHTVGVEDGYTETDVREVARCFTGWTLSEEVEDFFVFYPPFHDDGEKTVLGQTIPAGGGIEDGEQVIELLCASPHAASFIATKLARRFVSDQPPPALIDRLADRFTVTDGDIREVLRTLLLSAEFRASAGQKFKRPGELIMSTLRKLQPDLTDGAFLVLIQQLQRMGHLPFYWNPPTGYPDAAAYWISSASLIMRTNLSIAIAQGEVTTRFRDEEKTSQRKTLLAAACKLGAMVLPPAPAKVQPALMSLDPLTDAGKTEAEERAPVMADAIQLPALQMLGEARTPAAIADTMIARVLDGPLAATDRQIIVDYVAAGLDPNEPLALPRAVQQARGAIALLLNSRPFQYR